MDKYDHQLFSILCEVKTIPNFFDVIFGFLYRRTDFYHVASDPNVNFGLPVGYAERMVYESYKKLTRSKQAITVEQKQVEDITSVNKIKQNTTQIEIKKTSERKKESSFDSYNGAVYDDYSWSQTITDVDIHIKIPKNLTAKQVTVNITPSNICVKQKDTDDIFIQGELCHKCKHQETLWSLDNCVLQIHLDKAQECWWDCLVQSEQRLNLNEMDCSRPFHELPEEARVKIEEMTWNQERKRLGLPTTDQINLEKTLKKAWNAEGSPFTGEYDPSNFILQ